MKPRKFRVTNINNFTDYIGTIPVVASVATVTDESQLRIIDRQRELGDFIFEEIIGEEETKESTSVDQHDVEKRSGDTQGNIKVTSPSKKVSKRGIRGRSRQKK